MGGYESCGVETADAFSRFLDRVGNHTERQQGDGLYFERDRTYYKLYVELLDQVYAS